MGNKIKKETEVVRECCEWLQKQGVLFWRSNNLAVFGRSLPKFTPKGLPDINVIINGQYAGIEVKREGSETERENSGRRVRAGLLSPFQAEWGAKLTMHNAKYEIVRSVEELEGFVTRWRQGLL